MRRKPLSPSSPPSAASPTTIAATLLDYAALSVWLATPISTLRSMVHRGQVPAVRLAPRIVRFDRDAITQWLAERRIGGAQ